jgi:hypothetical protein
MPERLYKLQPNRALHLRGFDGLGASAALHSATASGFEVSGSFRDGADFAVLVLHDADNFFDHPRIRHLPDFDFDGLGLTFDVEYSGLMKLDSPKFPTIDWPYLDVAREDGTVARIRLFDYATKVSGAYTAASTTIVITAGVGLRQYDRLTLWYLNYAFDYICPQTECSLVITASGVAGTEHRVTVDGTDYIVSEAEGETNTSLTGKMAAALAAATAVHVTQVGGNQLDFINRIDEGRTYNVSGATGSATLHAVGPRTIAANLAAQLSSADYGDSLFPLTATASGVEIHVRCTRPGEDGNALVIYSQTNNGRIDTNASHHRLAGGSSEAVWRVSLQFASLGVPRIRQMWLTFAPPIAYGAATGAIEWRARFTNWTVTGPEEKRTLRVASVDSVRVEENDAWCRYSGEWVLEEGFFSHGFARRAAVAGALVTVKYACAVTHDLYLGTSLYSDRGRVAVSLDGSAETELNCYLAATAAVNTRRLLRQNVPAGQHDVTIRLLDSKFFYFDFLEAAVPADVPEALPALAHFSPALDYSTDHTYKLSPARLMWNFDQMGFAGPMNEYLGVFWWNQRTRVGAVIPQVKVTFGGSWLAGDQVLLLIGGQQSGKYLFGGESSDQIASHFAWFINATYVGVYAAADGPQLTITARSPMPAYRFPFSLEVIRVTGSTGTAEAAGSLATGAVGEWIVDPTQNPVLNAGTRAWHADLFRECQRRNWEITVATSMELVNAPGEFAARFPDGEPVETSVGFGSLRSTHCAFSSPMRTYHRRVYLELAGLMTAAGVTPSLQFGEFVWWFFSSQTGQNPNGGMAFYDAETEAAAQTTLGRALHRFRKPTDSPAVNGGADAAFLRNRLRDYVAYLRAEVLAVYPSTRFELLFPYDVNHPEPAGVHQLGGALNRFVNFADSWESKASSGLDRIKMEALDFGAWSRNLNLSKTAMEFPILLGWPHDSVRYLVPVFRAGSAWEREYLTARGLRIPVINFWAFDHFCIYGLDARDPVTKQ